MIGLFVFWVWLLGEQKGYFNVEFDIIIAFSAVTLLMLSYVVVMAYFLNKADKRRLLESERNLNMLSIIESSSDAVIGKTFDGVITSWSGGATKLYGYLSS